MGVLIVLSLLFHSFLSLFFHLFNSLLMTDTQCWVLFFFILCYSFNILLCMSGNLWKNKK